MLGGYALYQKEQNNNLRDDIKDVENNLETSEKQAEGIENAREEELKQNENVILSEAEKARSSDKIDDILELSETQDVPVKL